MENRKNPIPSFSKDLTSITEEVASMFFLQLLIIDVFSPTPYNLIFCFGLRVLGLGYAYNAVHARHIDSFTLV